MAYCQDTGAVVVDVCVVIKRVYKEEYLRVSMVYDPVFERKNLREIP
jgi:fumarate hydratase subunit alpha